MSTAAELPHELAPEVALPRQVPAESSSDDLPITRVERKSGWQVLDLRELWQYRDLLFILTWRDIKVRYKQTVLGAAWAILQPLATMVVFTAFLGPLVNQESLAYPYPIYVFVGLVAWSFFAGSISAAGSSVVGNQNLVTKVYFPRLMIPMGAMGPPLVDFAIAFVILLGLMLLYGVAWSPGLLLVPFLLLGLFLAALGVGTLLSALTVAYRDFRHAVPFLVQLWMFSTPVIYIPESALGPKSHLLLPLNPAFGLILNFRRCVLGQPLDGYSLGVSLAVSLLFVVAGSFYFKRVERSFADII